MTARVHWEDGLTLEEYARRWADMEPHLATLARLVSGSRTVVELGVRGGVSTWAILRGLPQDGWLLGVDINPEIIEMVPMPVLLDPRLRLVIGDDLTLDLPSADVVFIDTTHTYDQTLAELELAQRLTASLIILHDWMSDGVHDATAEFATRGGYRIVGIEPSDWGMAWLERRP